LIAAKGTTIHFAAILARLDGNFRMFSGLHRNLILDTIDKISQSASISSIASMVAEAMQKFGFDAMGINALPPAGDGADPFILAESAPEGFRDLYIHERFYLVDHICAVGRAAYEPFRYDEAPYDRKNLRGHQRFIQALDTFGMGSGLVVPIGRPANVPACVWLAGKNPDLDEDATRAAQLISLFAASKAYARSRSPDTSARTSKLTPREREVLQWISAGKTSWEIGTISGLSERSVNKAIADAMVKLDATTRTQAVVNAIRIGEIEL
jgi:DNA-binding CsgD family transcriptional regulator